MKRETCSYKVMLKYGLIHEKGYCYYNYGILYEGDWLNDLKERKGTMYYSNEIKYI